MPEGGTLLAFDYGERRIGVAVGSTETGLAHPLETVSGEGNDARFAAIGKLIEEWRPVQLVVGIPAHLDGRPHELAEACERFARRLEGRFRLPVARVDETLSSASASARLNEAGVRGRRQKAMLDSVAAQEILQSYLDGECHESA